MPKRKIARVAFLHNLLSPLNLELFIRISSSPKLSITYLILAESDPNRPWKLSNNYRFKYKVLPSQRITLSGQDSFSFFINPTLWRELNKLNPHTIVVSGWDQPGYWLALLWAKLNRAKIVLWSGSTEGEASWRRTITRLPVRVFIRAMDSTAAYGTRAKQYLQSFGYPTNSIHVSFNTTNLKPFGKVAYLRQRKTHQEGSLGLANTITIMFYGQLIRRKGPDKLLSAFLTLNKRFPRLRLMIIGNGPLKIKLQHTVARHKLSSAVRIIDYPGEKEILKYFAIADLFVLPSSEEVWGLVINQAMASGLPIVATKQVGSAIDLVDPLGGLIIPSNSPANIAKGIKRVLACDLSKLGKYNQSKIQRFSPLIQANAFIEAITSTL